MSKDDRKNQTEDSGKILVSEPPFLNEETRPHHCSRVSFLTVKFPMIEVEDRFFKARKSLKTMAFMLL
jgi:hypothetical protein